MLRQFTFWSFCDGLPYLSNFCCYPAEPGTPKDALVFEHTEDGIEAFGCDNAENLLCVHGARQTNLSIVRNVLRHQNNKAEVVTDVTATTS